MKKLGAAAVLVIIMLAGCRTLPDIEGLASHRELAQEDSKFINIDGFEIHYKTFGEGDQAMVMLHGFLSNLHTWDYIVEDLSDDYLIYSYDRLAFGITERIITDEEGNRFPRSSSPYRTDRVLERLGLLLDAWDLDEVILVGNSAGANLAVQAALAYPERVTGLVLTAPAIYRSGPPGFVRLILRTGLFERFGLRYIRRFADEDDSIFGASWYDPEMMSEELKYWYRQPLKAENWDRALWEYTRMNSDPGIVRRLDELSLPILIIQGKQDEIVPADKSIRLSGDIPHAQLVMLDETGHAPQEERPGETSRLIREFTESIRISPQGP